MKKVAFLGSGVTAFAVVVATGINVSISNDIENDATLANVEALVMGEGNANGNYWCCSPYDVECAIGDKVTIWGHLKDEECPK